VNLFAVLEPQHTEKEFVAVCLLEAHGERVVRRVFTVTHDER
jgi:hypothetical protein